MRILVGCKVVVEEQDIVVGADGSLDLSKATPKISTFDLNALQTAVDIKASLPETSITALSVEGSALSNTKVTKDILSRGVDGLAVAMDASFEGLLPEQTSELLGKMAGELGYDLIITGDGSSDLYAQQSGLLLGGLLNIPSINGVSKIIEAKEGAIVVERALERNIETLEIPLPAVISVSTDINTPAIPGMKAILGAAKKPVTKMDIKLEGRQTVTRQSALAPKKRDRKQIIIKGDDEGKIVEFISNIKEIL